MEMTLAQGLSSGFIKRTPEGFEPKGPTAEAKAQAQAKQAKAKADAPMSSLSLETAKGTLGPVADKMGSLEKAEKMFGRILAAQLRDEGAGDSQAVSELAHQMGVEREVAVDLANKFLGGFASDVELGLQTMGLSPEDSRAALNHYVRFHRSDAYNVLNALYVGVSKAERTKLLSGKVVQRYSRVELIPDPELRQKVLGNRHGLAWMKPPSLRERVDYLYEDEDDD